MNLIFQRKPYYAGKIDDNPAKSDTPGLWLRAFSQHGLELVQHAVSTYEIMDAPDKGSYLKIMPSNSIWKDGELRH